VSRSARRVAGLVFGVACAVGACVEPTEVKLVLTTNIPTLTRVQVLLDGDGGANVVADQAVRAPGRLGTLVFVPSSPGGRFTVRVRGLEPVNDCENDPKIGCVEASRTVSFLPHRSLELPIDLSSACLGVTCGTNETCVDGLCVGDVVTTEDAGVIVPPSDDGGVVTDGGAPATCVLTATRQLAHATLTARYPFSDIGGMATREVVSNAKVSIPMGWALAPAASNCTTSLQPGPTGTMPLLTNASMTALNLIVWVQPLASASYTVVAATNGWRLELVPADPNGALAVRFAPGGNLPAVSTVTTLAVDMQWHLIELARGASGTIQIAIDNHPTEKLTTTFAPGQPLELRANAAPLRIDELRVYTGP